jgi:sugar O-acyltransferase (sialic acid O-acetyltransferase NeuD family)
MEAPNEMKDIIVIGGGGHARVIISILRKIRDYNIRGYTDPRNCGALLNVPYLGTDLDISNVVTPREKHLVLAVGQIGSGRSRHGIYSRLASLRLIFSNVISPDAIVNEGVAIEAGVVIMDGAIVNTGAKLGVGVIANTHATIEHDVTLEDWVHIAPGATISGGVTVGRYSMIGAGATVIEGKTIAPETIVGAGATVVHDLLEPGVYVGTPARRLR